MTAWPLSDEDSECSKGHVSWSDVSLCSPAGGAKTWWWTSAWATCSGPRARSTPTGAWQREWPCWTTPCLSEYVPAPHTHTHTPAAPNPHLAITKNHWCDWTSTLRSTWISMTVKVTVSRTRWESPKTLQYGIFSILPWWCDNIIIIIIVICAVLRDKDNFYLSSIYEEFLIGKCQNNGRQKLWCIQSLLLSALRQRSNVLGAGGVICLNICFNWWLEALLTLLVLFMTWWWFCSSEVPLLKSWQKAPHSFDRRPSKSENYMMLKCCFLITLVTNVPEGLCLGNNAQVKSSPYLKEKRKKRPFTARQIPLVQKKNLV